MATPPRRWPETRAPGPEVAGHPAGLAAGGKGSIKVNLTTLNSGVAKRDQNMQQPQYLDTANAANKFPVFEIKSIDIAGPLEAGTTFTNHNMTVPEMLRFKLSNEIEPETDLTFARP